MLKKKMLAISLEEAIDYAIEQVTIQELQKMTSNLPTKRSKKLPLAAFLK